MTALWAWLVAFWYRLRRRPVPPHVSFTRGAGRVVAHYIAHRDGKTRVFAAGGESKRAARANVLALAERHGYGP